MSEDAEREAYRRGYRQGIEDALLKLDWEFEPRNYQNLPLSWVRDMLRRRRSDSQRGEWPKGGDDANVH